MAASSAAQLPRVLLLAALCLVAVVSCVQAPRLPEGAAIAVDMGSPIRLLDVPTSHDKVAVLIDDAGNARVVISSPRTNRLYFLTVNAAGTISHRETVRSGIKPASVDLALDDSGRFHLLVDQDHLVREADGHWSSLPTPWGKAGLEVFDARFVPGSGRAGPLVHAFTVPGKELGAPARWDFFGIGGGFGAGIIVPWRTRGSRLAIVEEDGGRYDTWSVVGLDEREDVSNWQAVADKIGRVHIVYDAERQALVAAGSAFYARVEPRVPDEPGESPLASKRRSRAVPGTSFVVDTDATRRGLGAALAVNPYSDELLLVRAHVGAKLCRDGAWGPDIPLPVPLLWEPRAVAGPDGRFHVVWTSRGGKDGQTIFHLRLKDGVWTAPITVGSAKVEGFYGMIGDAVRIAGTGNDRIFVTWPVTDGIEARWIDVPSD